MLTLLMPVAFVLQCAVIAAWLWQHVLISRIDRDGLRLAPVSSNADVAHPSLTVIIPARNESQGIIDCLRSVYMQGLATMEVVVVDDRSTDDTSRQAAAFRSDGRGPRVISIDDLPEGWLGKSHALWVGAQAAQGEWLVLLDADCRLRPGAIVSALRFASRRGVDLLSLWPADGSQSFWEHVLIPLCGAQIVIWYGSPQVRGPKRRPAFANGQFIVVKRDAYFRFGGHAAVRDAIIEDVPLARRAARCGLEIMTALGSDLFAVRMYTSLKQIVSGWTRIFTGVLTTWQMALCVLWLLVGSAWPFAIITLAATWAAIQPSTWSILWLVAGTIHLLALASVSVRFFALSHCRPAFLLFYPLSIAGVLLILARAMFFRIASRPITWKETTYRVEAAHIVPAAPPKPTRTTLP